MPEVNFNLLNPNADLYSGPNTPANPQQAFEWAQGQRLKQEAEQQSNVLAQLYAKHYDPQTGGVNYNKLIGDMASSGMGKLIPDVVTKAQAYEKSKAETEGIKEETKVRRQNAIKTQIESARTAYEGIYIPTDEELQTPGGKKAYNDAFNSFLGVHNKLHSDENFQEMYAATGNDKDAAFSQIMSAYNNPNAFRQLVMNAQMGSEKTLEALDKQATQKRQEAIAAETERAHRASEKTAEGNLKVSQAREAREAEQQRRANDPQFQAGLAEAKKRGELIAAGDVAAIQTLPATIQKAESALNVIDQMIGPRIQATDKDGKKLTNPDGSPKYIPDTPENAKLYNKNRHAGFSNAVGAGIPFASSVPGTETANFSSMHDQVTSQAFLQAYETLRGTGSIATKEGEKATAAITRMNKSQSEAEYVKAAREFQDSVQKMIDNAKKKADTAQRKVNPIKVPGTGTKDDPYKLD